MKGITREQRSEILRLVGIAIRANCDPSFLGGSQLPSEELINYLDSLVAEPAEQPKKSFEQLAHDAYRDAAFGTRRDQEGARLHADDARAAMQVRLAWWLHGDNDRGTRADQMRESCLDADAMQAERKRRQG